ncbi:MAG: response regulator [Oliverpabstia sp.]
MRHNLLIVDDEELIRHGLKARIEYLEIDVDEIFEAENGTEALEIVKNCMIDIVITDIRMPDMDGITMIQEMKKLYPDIQFVVLSGYAEFSYAETAIRLGVKSYLLKPLSNEELKKTMQKIYAEMEATAKIRYIERLQKKMDKEKQEYILEKKINAFFANPGDKVLPVEELDQLTNLKISKNYSKNRKVYLAIIHVDKESYKDDGFQQIDYELIRFSLKNVFCEITTNCEKLIVNSLSDYNNLYGLFIMDDKKRLRNEIERLFLKMKSVLEKKMDIYFTFGVSRCNDEICNTSLKEAQEALKQRIIYGKSNLYFSEDIKLMNNQPISTSQMQLLEQYIEKNEIHKIRKILSEIFSDETVQEYGTTYIRIMWVRILNLIFHFYGRKSGKWGEEIENILTNFNLPEHVQSVPEIQQRIIDIIMGCARTKDVTEVDGKNKIQMAVQFIKDHYRDNLTVNDLAEMYGMSPNYFSSIFKKEMKLSPVNYITGIRMEKAKELLEYSELSVVEIAQKTGYEDGQYFFRVFKKYTGMTPLQYRGKNNTISSEK